MRRSYRELVRQAEDAVRGVKDKELRREAFRMLLLQLLAGGDIGIAVPGRTVGAITAGRRGRPRGPGRPPGRRGRPPLRGYRPGRRGGGVATTAIQKLIDKGYFRTGRDAAVVMRDLDRKGTRLMPSQLRMVLLRFSRARKLKRRIKMKGMKVTYLYSTK